MGLEAEIKHLDAKENGLHVISETELKEMQAFLVRMVNDLNEFCKANAIEWGLTGGSVIGAVRHKGFIPWDDDIDIVMTRENFNRFKSKVKEWKNDKYEFLCPGDKGYYSHIPKLFSTNTYLKLIQPSGRGTGLFIDIFVLDNTPDNSVLRCLHGIECTFYLFVISTMVTHHQKKELMQYGSEKLQRQVKLRDLASIPFRIKPVEWWIDRGTKCFSKIKDNCSKFVVSATGGGHYFHEIYLRKAMCNYTEHIFEDHSFPIMKGYDYFLSLRYGKDYMKVPPKEKWERHAVVDLNLCSGHPVKDDKEYYTGDFK